MDFVHGAGLLMAPTVAVARMLKQAGLSLQDFDYYEIHEAFAAQVLCTLRAWESADYCKKELGLDRALGAIDPAKLKAPVFGGLAQQIAISRFTRNLGTMVHSGVPILQALDITAQTTGNVVIERAVNDVQESVRRGEPLARPLADHPVFPAMVVQMMSVGEDTGALDTMLHKISDFYDAEVEATTESLTSLIEPLMIAVVGGMIGAMIIALYMPIFKVFDLIK